MKPTLLANLKQPPQKYRTAPLWSWNDNLIPEVLRLQVREMKKAGIGGFFMHARPGLRTKYMSEEWMECIKASIDEGKNQGVIPWLYDENTWPSGMAGGVVPAMGDKYHSRWIEMKEFDSQTELDSSVIGIYQIEDDGEITYISPEVFNGHLAKDKPSYVISHKSNPHYIDMLNQEVVKAFIEATHEKYYTLFKDEFGSVVPGFFSDEAQFARDHMPWSYVIPNQFLEKHSYDLIEKLPAVFMECKDYESIRYCFWEIVNELFVEAYAKQIYDWCEAHNVKFTGHMIHEDNLPLQMRGTGGVMPFYEYFHIPGLDSLGRGLVAPHVSKQVSSVAAQLNKEMVLSEMFGMVGWNVSFEELKWIAESQYVHGINFMCQHLESYSLRGLRKRDYPPSLFLQQPWWEDYHAFLNYFGRLSVLLTEGKQVVDVLMLHPIKSAWIIYDGTENESLRTIDWAFSKLTRTLLGYHIDHHYGDETLIRKHGRVEADRLIIGHCQYKTVIMPPMLTLDSYTIELLEQFISNEGRVVSVGIFPDRCDGRVNARLTNMKKKVVCLGYDWDTLHEVLVPIVQPAIRITGTDGEIGAIHYQQREWDDTKLFYIVNHDANRAYNAVITLQGTGHVKKFIAESGEFTEIDYTNDGSITRILLSFLPMQSHILFLETESPSRIEPFAHPPVTCIIPSNEWEIESMDWNALTIDYCDFCIDGREWVGPTHTIHLLEYIPKDRDFHITLRYTFDVEIDLANNREMFLIVERPNDFDISVNGSTVKHDGSSWWKDHAFKKIDIRNLVKVGRNEVFLKKTYQRYEDEKELESIYIVGDFGVVSKSGYTYGERRAVTTEGPFAITELPKTVISGSLTEQGLCFFAGNVTLTQQIRVEKKNKSPIMLELGKPDSVIMKVFVNDRLVNTLTWAPYQVDITQYVSEGDNKLNIQLFGSNRNLLGPHHNILGESHSVGFNTFTSRSDWEEECAYGIKPGTNIWTDKYNFVKFGLQD